MCSPRPRRISTGRPVAGTRPWRPRGLELVEKGSRRGTLSSHDVLGLVAMGRGETSRAQEHFESTLAISRAGGEVDLILTALWGLAETALLANDPQGSIDRCDEAWDLAQRTGERALLIPFVVTGARAHLAARRPDAAAAWVERVREHLVDWLWLAGRRSTTPTGSFASRTGRPASPASSWIGGPWLGRARPDLGGDLGAGRSRAVPPACESPRRRVAAPGGGGDDGHRARQRAAACRGRGGTTSAQGSPRRG